MSGSCILVIIYGCNQPNSYHRQKIKPVSYGQIRCAARSSSIYDASDHGQLSSGCLPLGRRHTIGHLQVNVCYFLTTVKWHDGNQCLVNFDLALLIDVSCIYHHTKHSVVKARQLVDINHNLWQSTNKAMQCIGFGPPDVWTSWVRINDIAWLNWNMHMPSETSHDSMHSHNQFKAREV